MKFNNEMELPHIQWFPGHMKKAQRLVEENLKFVDVVIELRDARVPQSSSNPMLTKIIAQKPRVVALNKADLADPVATKLWLKWLKEQSIMATALDSMTGKGVKSLVNLAADCARPQINKFTKAGGKGRAIRCMVVGTPNVGKSSLINRLAGTSKAKTENRPGVTRAKQWIKVSSNLELLDMPGILWPKFENQEVALKLAITGAINDEIYDKEQVALLFMDFLQKSYPLNLVKRFRLTSVDELSGASAVTLELLGRKRGFLHKGGIVDIEKTVTMLLSEFRLGKIGKITLELPENTVTD